MDKDLLQRYVEGNVTPEEVETVVDWLDVDNDNVKEYMSLHKLYDISVLNQSAQLQEKVKKSRSFVFRRIIMEIGKVAAVALFIVGIEFLLNKEEHKGEPSLFQTLYVPSGQRAELILPDSTRVWVNAQSRIVYPVTFQKNCRQVELEGEAYFDVTKKKKTPFIVRTDKYDIEVLGTQFDVDAYPDQTAFETTLMKGSVKVTSQHFPEQTITLKPHHKAYVKDGQLAVTKVNDFTPYRWKEGLICFKDEPFQTIMEDFEKYYGIRIIINNKKVLKYSYNGKFRQADGIDYALRVLQRDIHFKYERANDEEIIYIN